MVDPGHVCPPPSEGRVPEPGVGNVGGVDAEATVLVGGRLVVTHLTALRDGPQVTGLLLHSVSSPRPTHPTPPHCLLEEGLGLWRGRDSRTVSG